jgi:hypothetical protein
MEKKHMKTPKIFLILICTLLPHIVFAQGYTWQALSVNDAMQSVRAFEGNSNLALTVLYSPTLANVQPGIETPYRFQSNRYEYRICAFCSTSFSRDDITFTSNKDIFYGQTYDNDALATKSMSQSSAQAIATAFMQSHYPNSSVLTLLTVKPHIAFKASGPQSDFIDTYEFDFDQDCGNGVLGPSNCSIEVDTVNGQIVSYGANYFPVLISTVPALTQNYVMATAMNMMQIQNGQPGTVDGLAVSFPDAFGVEHLVYDLTFSGIGPAFGSTLPYDEDHIFYLPPNTSTIYPQADQDYSAFIDANSGRVIHWSIFLSGDNKKKSQAKYDNLIRSLRNTIEKRTTTAKPLCFQWSHTVAMLNYPPYLVGKKPYMCLTYLSYGVSGVKITITQAKQVAVASLERQVSLSLNSQSYQVNSQPKKMSSKPIILNGRCYVPMDVMQTVLGGKWSYEAKAQTVRYDPPQIKQAYR